MATYSAITSVTGQDRAEAIGEALEKLQPEPYGVGVYEIEDGKGIWEVGAYYTDPPSEALLLLLSTAFASKPFLISELPDIDWVAKVRRDLAPVTAGRFFLFGSHDIDKVPADVVPLQIEATVAFGTGHHGTTLGCLRALDRIATEGFVGTNVADIGTGTGVLALAAAAIWPDAQVIASDIDEVAVDVAKANTKINKMDERLPCVEAAGFDHRMLKARAPYDLIFANILKGPLIELAPAVAAHAKTDTRVILSGLLAVQAEAVLAAYAAQGFAQGFREDIGEWSTLTLIKG